jgi:hypothetical protein
MKILKRFFQVHHSFIHSQESFKINLFFSVVSPPKKKDAKSFFSHLFFLRSFSFFGEELVETSQEHGQRLFCTYPLQIQT